MSLIILSPSSLDIVPSSCLFLISVTEPWYTFSFFKGKRSKVLRTVPPEACITPPINIPKAPASLALDIYSDMLKSWTPKISSVKSWDKDVKASVKPSLPESIPKVFNTSTAVLLAISLATTSPAFFPPCLAAALAVDFKPLLNKPKALAPAGPITPSKTPSDNPLKKPLANFSFLLKFWIFSSSEKTDSVYSPGINKADITPALASPWTAALLPPLAIAAAVDAIIIGALSITVLKPILPASNSPLVFPVVKNSPILFLKSLS